ncbi:MAG: DUF2088 domain-containing protein [Acidobacteria bacterium]|nr:DUF2088 domain-containing protein [Acidobacteriota bacterium]
MSESGSQTGQWSQLARGVRLPIPGNVVVPDLHEVRLPIPLPDAVVDVESTVRATVVARFADASIAGKTIAVGAGSRGLTARVATLRGVVAGLRECGAAPFVVPAMGSHAGGTADGQVALLAALGVTDETIECEIRSTMRTVEVARTAEDMPLFLDEHAAGADFFLPVNRVKPHTCFKGPIESGCTKMAVVGFGKQPGAAQIHACGPERMAQRLLDGIAALRATGRLLGGVATIESCSGEVVRVEALSADEVGSERERELTDYARSLVPRLPFRDIDVLIVERGGKDISGTTIDPNVTGRFWVHGLADFDAPPATIVLLGVTEASGGNVLGIGLADFIPASVANLVDWEKTYLNCFTAGPSGVRRARMPMVLADEEECIRTALMMCGKAINEPKRIVRIRSTLHLDRAWVSSNLLDEIA